MRVFHAGELFCEFAQRASGDIMRVSRPCAFWQTCMLGIYTVPPDHSSKPDAQDGYAGHLGVMANPTSGSFGSTCICA